MGKKIHHCKDTLGKAGTDTLFLTLPADGFHKFQADCKYLGIPDGDEIAYRIQVEPEDRLPYDLRRELIKTEKMYFETEQRFRMILASKTATAEAKEIAAEMLEMTALLHPLWFEFGARRQKTASDVRLSEIQAVVSTAE